MDNKKQAFMKYLLKKSGAKTEEEFKKYIEKLGEEGLKKAQKEFENSQVESAKRGTKLNYLKSLKHQCAEDEEVYYFKKGGSVGCGCVKKASAGTEMEMDPIKKFKKSEKKGNILNNKKTSSENKKPSKEEIENGTQVYDMKLKKYRPVTKEDKEKQKQNNREAYKGKGEGEPQHKCGGKVKKHQEGSIITKFKAFR